MQSNQGNKKFVANGIGKKSYEKYNDLRLNILLAAL